MALSESIQKLAYARFLEPFQMERVWRNYVMDLSAEFPGYGQTIVLPTDTGATRTGSPNYEPDDRSTTYTPDATRANSLWAASTLTDLDVVELTINQERDISKLINFLSQRRVRPSLIASASRHIAREMMEAINNHLRLTLNAHPSPRPPITCTAAEFAAGNDSKVLDPLLNALADDALEADYRFYPNDSRKAIVSPRIHKYLVDKLIDEKLYLVNENPQYVNEGQVLKFRGWDIVKDVSPGDGVTADDDDKHSIFYLRPGIGLGFAGELARMRVFESEVEKGWVLRAIYTWGSAIVEPDKVMVRKFNITT